MTGGLLQAAFYILPSEVSLSFYEKALILSRLFLRLSENIFQTENWSERGKRTRRNWVRRYQKSVERTSKWFWFGALWICCGRYSSRNLQFWINATTARRGVFRRQDFIRLWITLDFNKITYLKQRFPGPSHRISSIISNSRRPRGPAFWNSFFPSWDSWF